MIQFQKMLSSLSAREVDFVIIGGVAATLHGSARVTFDLDIVYDRSSENLTRIVAALLPFEPYVRGAPLGLLSSSTKRLLSEVSASLLRPRKDRSTFG